MSYGARETVSSLAGTLVFFLVCVGIVTGIDHWWGWVIGATVAFVAARGMEHQLRPWVEAGKK